MIRSVLFLWNLCVVSMVLSICLLGWDISSGPVGLLWVSAFLVLLSFLGALVCSLWLRTKMASREKG